VVENYPELKANQNVLELQEQLTTTENQIGFARQHYNATVLDYNTAIATIPNNFIAGPFGFTRRDFFDAEPEAPVEAFAAEAHRHPVFRCGPVSETIERP
jgi:LemA protein